MDKSQQTGVFKLVAGLLHLGNVSFKGEDSSEVDPSTTAALDKAQELLGLKDLVKALVSRTMVRAQLGRRVA